MHLYFHESEIGKNFPLSYCGIKKYTYLCTRKRKSLGYGVMVTLQILVLSFLVRIQVAQQITSFLLTKTR